VSRHRIIECDASFLDEHHDRGRSERLRDRADLEQRVGVDLERMLDVRHSMRRGVVLTVYEYARGSSGNPMAFSRRAQHLGELPVDRHDGTLRGRRARRPHQDSSTGGQILTELVDRYGAPQEEALHHSEAESPQSFELFR
jgi:hypothetical protein